MIVGFEAWVQGRTSMRNAVLADQDNKYCRDFNHWNSG